MATIQWRDQCPSRSASLRLRFLRLPLVATVAEFLPTLAGFVQANALNPLIRLSSIRPFKPGGRWFESSTAHFRINKLGRQRLRGLSRFTRGTPPFVATSECQMPLVQ